MTDDKHDSMPAPVAEPSRKIFFSSTLAKPDYKTTTVTDMLERVKQLFNKQLGHLEREGQAVLLQGEQQKALIALTSSLVSLAKEERESLKDSNLSNMTTEELERLVAKEQK